MNKSPQEISKEQRQELFRWSMATAIATGQPVLWGNGIILVLPLKKVFDRAG